MRDYMKALCYRFETTSRRAEYLDRKIERTYRQLSRLLDEPERKLLLKMADLEDALREVSEQLHLWLPSGPGYPAGAAGGSATVQL